MVKQFVIQFETFDSTRWLCDDAQMALFVASVASECVRLKTEGAFPLTTVFPIVQAANEKPWNSREIIALRLKEGIIK